MYLLETGKFIDNTISVRALLPLEEKTITAWNLYLLMIRSKTEKYNSKQSFSRVLNNAYDTKVRYSLAGYGPHICLEIRFTYIRPSEIEDPDYPSAILEILDQVLHHPSLDEKGLEEAKFLLETRLDRMAEDPDYLSVRGALELAGKNHPISISMQGRREDLASITLEDILERDRIFHETPVQVHLCGERDEPVMDFLATLTQKDLEPVSYYPLLPITPLKQEAVKDISQTSLTQVYATTVTQDHPLFMALTVMNTILGQGEQSLLFEEVREKHSCCYAISSSLITFDAAMVITAGIERCHISLVESLIQEQIERIATGDFDEARMETAKLFIIDGLRASRDNAAALIEREYRQHLQARPLHLKTQIEKVKAVTKEEVMRAAQHLRLCATSLVMEEA